MYLCLYPPENRRDTDNVIKWTFIALLLITFHWLIETMLDHVTVVFSYATAVILNLKTQYVNINSGFTG